MPPRSAHIIHFNSGCMDSLNFGESNSIIEPYIFSEIGRQFIFTQIMFLELGVQKTQESVRLYIDFWFTGTI